MNHLFSISLLLKCFIFSWLSWQIKQFLKQISKYQKDARCKIIDLVVNAGDTHSRPGKIIFYHKKHKKTCRVSGHNLKYFDLQYVLIIVSPNLALQVGKRVQDIRCQLCPPHKGNTPIGCLGICRIILVFLKGGTTFFACSTGPQSNNPILMLGSNCFRQLERTQIEKEHLLTQYNLPHRVRGEKKKD